MTPHNLKIIYKDGSTVDMWKDLSTIVQGFDPSSPEPIIYTEEIQGRHGAIPMGKDYAPQSLPARCTMDARDFYDYSLLRNKIYKALNPFDAKGRTEEFYIVSDSEPGKRWKVEVDSSFTPSRIANLGEFTIPFISFQTFSESIGTSLDPMTFDPELWQWGQGIPLDEVSYIHNTNEFVINNIGDVRVDPREHLSVIEFKGASSNLTIENLTTGDRWEYYGDTQETDTIRLERVKSKKNGLSIIGSTNKELISLAPGENNLKLSGTSGSFEVTFDFRFLYF
ncbi:phage tail family protein [Salipaludibacillus sp. CF4.18]|uniref:phage tail family protein n=1 Tax=Salipaludibacillus sp. CF4.18 TaxID=3373081 RepID=UPI003EE4AAE5